jgi:hypothetical protein
VPPVLKSLSELGQLFAVVTATLRAQNQLDGAAYAIGIAAVINHATYQIVVFGDPLTTSHNDVAELLHRDPAVDHDDPQPVVTLPLQFKLHDYTAEVEGLTKLRIAVLGPDRDQALALAEMGGQVAEQYLSQL